MKMKRRMDKTKKVRGHKWSQVEKHKMYPGPPCFVCGEEIINRGIPLLVGHTAHSKTGLPTKIGQLMGDGFMVVVNTEDMVCRRCASLLDHLDKLEIDLCDIKSSLLNYLKIKYQLLDEDEYDADVTCEQIVVSEEKTTTGKQIKTEVFDPCDDSPVQEPDGKDDVSGSEWEEDEITKKVNVEIILDENHTQRRNTQSSSPETTQYYEFDCDKCGFGTNSISEIEEHPTICSNFNHECRICGKKFASSKNVQDHIMQTHLSKWTCHICSTNFSEEQEFTAHLCVHITDKGEEASSGLKNALGNYECNICDFECSDKRDFDDHIRKHVVLKPFKCKDCGRRFEEEHLFDEHCETHKIIFKCQVCSAQFSLENDYVEHMKQHSRVMMSDDVTVWANKQDKLLSGNKTIEFDKLGLKHNEELGRKEDGIKFLSCSLCSLTFLNNALYEQHMKNHSEVGINSNSKDDIMDTDNSLISSLVDTNNFDSVIDGSLEDMFEKIHSHVDSPDSKPIANFVSNSAENTKDEFRCELSSSHMLKTNSESSRIHSNTCLVGDMCVNSSNVKKFLSNTNILKCQEPLNLNSVNSNDLDQNSFSEDDKINPIIPELIHNSNILKEVENENKFSIKKVVFDNLYSLPSDKNNIGKCDVTGESNSFSSINNMNGLVFSNNSAVESNSEVKKTFICAECGLRFSSLTNLREHFKEHQKNSSNTCTLCYKSFTNKMRLKKHLKAHENCVGGKMTCPNCYEEFPDYVNLFQHMQEKHPKEKIVYKCEFCSEKFTSRKAFKAHEENHPERFEFKCDECNQSFMKGKQLKDHKDSVHRDPHCRYCGKEIVKLKTLRNHELRHLREKDHFECDVCKRVFKTKTGLRHHVAVHTGEYKYCCDYCGRGFMSRMMMEEHRSMHTKEERYVCDVCGRKFSFQSTYWIHRKWHDNPYPYKCSFCNRMFRHSSLLAVHKRKHTGERPYQCPHCPLSFPVGGTLKRHLILHTGKYPFNCDSCKRGFTTRHKYATHLAKVHGDYELLNMKQSHGEYKMVIREEPKQSPDFSVWNIAEESQHSDMNFKLEVAAAGDSIDQMNTSIPCSIVAEDLLTDSGVAARVVEIVLDDESQAVATVTLAEPNPNILPELWYQ